jgi:serine O-acetyltransferase
MIMQQVTIGQTAESSAPNIGMHVYIGAGAEVLGNVTVGDGAQIEANAVVLIDVPPIARRLARRPAWRRASAENE